MYWQMLRKLDRTSRRRSVRSLEGEEDGDAQDASKSDDASERELEAIALGAVR